MSKRTGRPAHEPTPENREKVAQLARAGVVYSSIARAIGVSAPTLSRYYRDELERGVIDANAAVAGALFNQAMRGNTTAAIFWLKSRAGWREKHEVALTVEDIRKTLSKATDEELLSLAYDPSI